MANDLIDIASAIRELKSDSLKDYVFPTFLSFVSASMGVGAAVGAARYTVRTQEHNKVQLENINAINDLFIQASSARNTLITLKSQYYLDFPVNPYFRMICIPEVMIDSRLINFDMSRLTFLVPSEPDANISNWQRIEYINSVVVNYNNLITMWEKRNDLYRSLQPKFIKQLTSEAQKINLSDVLIESEMIQLFNLTEQVIVNTDDILFELSCFLLGFPFVAKQKVDKKVMEKYRKVMQMKLPCDKRAVDILSFVKPLDITEASKLLRMPEEQIRNRYKYNYQRGF
ncbi:hypothetical protein NB610_13045 [Vibrio alginolyticus]|nr:hypothetical protein [Vibrio alginolyticus]